MNSTSQYAELHCVSNFTFLRGASRPEELVETAAALGYQAIAITDECSMAGVVRAHSQAKKTAIKLIIGNEFRMAHGCRLVLLARNHRGYTQLCSLISEGRCDAEKGDYSLGPDQFASAASDDCIAILVPPRIDRTGVDTPANETQVAETIEWFKKTYTYSWLSLTLLHHNEDQSYTKRIQSLAAEHKLPIVATGDVHMHTRQRRALQDVVTCIREHCTLQTAGRKLATNGEQHLQKVSRIASRYPARLINESVKIAALCDFSLDELHYEYPKELVPDNLANSAVCFCLGITEVDPMRMSMLFERFISKERNEPPDIDVDFEHERREEVIQYIYNKYGRHRTALAATVISYRRRSAIRDVGKVLGLQEEQIDALAKSMAWWDGTDVIPERLTEMGFAPDSQLMKRFDAGSHHYSVGQR